MIIVLSLVGLSLAAGGLIAHEMKYSPEAYEDYEGFHFIRRTDTQRTGGFLKPAHRIAEQRGEQAGRGPRSAASAA